jgi:hypothetical protein
MLLSFPGFHVTQSFECINGKIARFGALHRLDGLDFLLVSLIRKMLVQQEPASGEIK